MHSLLTTDSDSAVWPLAPLLLVHDPLFLSASWQELVKIWLWQLCQPSWPAQRRVPIHLILSQHDVQPLSCYLAMCASVFLWSLRSRSAFRPCLWTLPLLVLVLLCCMAVGASSRCQLVTVAVLRLCVAMRLPTVLPCGALTAHLLGGDEKGTKKGTCERSRSEQEERASSNRNESGSPGSL
jgi:hypothetical protein